MKSCILVPMLMAFAVSLLGQLPATIWKGGLTQLGVADTFSYEVQLAQQGSEVSGTAFSINKQGVKVQFSVHGTWNGQQLLLQEWRQDAPASPRWCLKYLNPMLAKHTTCGVKTSRTCKIKIQVSSKALSLVKFIAEMMAEEIRWSKFPLQPGFLRRHTRK